MQLRDAFLTMESTTEGRAALRLTAIGGRVRSTAAQVLPSCAELSTVVQADGPLVVVEGFVGDSLAAVVRTAPLRAERALVLLRAMATAVDELHRMGFVHGRLRPASFVVDAQQRVRLVDWAIEWGAPTAVQLRELAHALAPEVIFGEAPRAASDQFAFGALAHELLTGQKPFGGETASETLLAALCGTWSVGEASELPVDALGRAFSPEPAQRFNSCAAFVEAAEREIAEAAAPLAAPAPVAPGYAPAYAPPALLEAEEAPGWWARHGLLVAGVCAALAFVLGIASWFVQRQVAEVQASVSESAKAANWTLGDNGRLKVCNTAQHPVVIRNLAVGYWDSKRRLSAFESSRVQHGGWTVAPDSEQNLSIPGAWDGSVVFYYLHVEQQGKEYLLSVTWQAVAKGCLEIASQ